MNSTLKLLCKSLLRSSARNLGTASEAVKVQEERLPYFRTSENNPALHTEQHVGRLYTIPDDIFNSIFQLGGVHGQLKDQFKTFGENALLIREPTVELISYLKYADYKDAAKRYCLYGLVGTGKVTTMAHIIHYAHMEKKIIVHVPKCKRWLQFPKEVTILKDGGIELPVDAAEWLTHFLNQNQAVIRSLDLRIDNAYEWNQRESSPKGTSLVELVTFGINRIKYACRVIDVLCDELKAASTAGKCNTLVALPGFNMYSNYQTSIKDDTRKKVDSTRISVVQSFNKMVKYDWCNSAIVLIADQLSAQLDQRESELPRYLLGEKTFEEIDPFIPIHLKDYDASEFRTMIDYYKDRKWIRNVDNDGIRELELLTNRNPLKLMHYSAPL